MIMGQLGNTSLGYKWAKTGRVYMDGLRASQFLFSCRMAQDLGISVS
jgi:hypothetical protein